MWSFSHDILELSWALIYNSNRKYLTWILRKVTRMKANETIIQPMIEGTKQFVIPLFQRTYSWSNQQWNQLWEDILDIRQKKFMKISLLISGSQMIIISSYYLRK
ncbi:DUF262 domain-containing protein [Metabacillus niabensis]|uniref:GmrSD restriction endonuclease domain-containing protein n=1 Tax=Metabacillus niabensis TaxID=324854 RepID=UPI0039B122E0